MALFVDGVEPTESEMKAFKLLLSTYQDGSGMLADGFLPGWRDFERVSAAWIAGSAPESKHIYDVHISVPGDPQGLMYGYSCKMKKDLAMARKGRFYIEVSNSSSLLWQALNDIGVTAENIRSRTLGVSALDMALALTRTIHGWHHAVCSVQKPGHGKFVSAKSPMLHLSYHRPTELQASKGQLPKYKLYALHKHFPTEDEIRSYEWSVGKKNIRGLQDGVTVVDFYFDSGFQVKWYPTITDAQTFWESEEFELEPPPANLRTDFLSAKAAVMFPVQWKDATGMAQEEVAEIADAVEVAAEAGQAEGK